MADGPSRTHAQLHRLLSEREKELDAVYELATIFALPDQTRESVLERTAATLRASMQDPEHAVAHVTVDDDDAAATRFDRLAVSFQVSKRFGVNQSLRIVVGYGPSGDSPRRDHQVVEREERLVESTVELLAKVLERIEIDNVLRESTRALQRQAEELEQKNSALREILSQIQSEKDRTLEDARAHIAMFVEPYLYRLESHPDLDPDQRVCVQQVRRSIRDLVSSETAQPRRLSDVLTTRELEVCDLVRGGLTTKEISSFLRITPATVERHRNTIREKLGLTGQRVTLAAYLRHTE